MTYERDRDHALKGVGAIAARDAGNQNRQSLRIRQAQATQARDRMLARIGYDARGMRRGAMGAVDQTTAGVWAGPVSDSPPPTKLYEGAGSMPRQTQTATTVSARIALPPMELPPPPFSPMMSPPFAKPSGVQSPPFVPPAPVPVAPPVVLQPAGLTAEQKKWAVIGAVGLAAYLLFRDSSAAT